MNKFSAIFTALWMLAGTLPAQTASGLQAGIDLFRVGHCVWNAQAMEAARTEFSLVARGRPGEYPPLYWQSVSEFYLMLCYGLKDSTGYDPAKAEVILKLAEKTMKAAIDARPQEAECHAMLSSVYGFRIVMHPVSAVWNGPKVLLLQHAALENDPDSPRALYIIGAGYFRAPGLFRNVGKAREFLEQAELIFEKTPDSAQPDQPQWGQAECKGLLGDLYREAGDTIAARRFYQAALQINPYYTPAVKALKGIDDENKN